MTDRPYPRHGKEGILGRTTPLAPIWLTPALAQSRRSGAPRPGNRFPTEPQRNGRIGGISYGRCRLQRVTARVSFPPFGGDELMTVYGTGGKIGLTGQWLGYWGEADPGAQ